MSHGDKGVQLSVSYMFNSGFSRRQVKSKQNRKISLWRKHIKFQTSSIEADPEGQQNT